MIEPDEKLPADLVALRRFAFWMDEAFTIPGTRFHIGADALLGLIPGIGDIIGGLLSTWIIAGALRHRVPARVIVRMVFNVVLDLLFGAVPIAGDVLDFLYEENIQNMRLLEKHRDRRRPPRTFAGVAFVVAGIVLFVLAVSVAIAIGLIVVVVWLADHRYGF